MMDVLLWIVAGGLVAWAGFGLLHFNAARGLAAAVVLGASGGLLGGYVLGPIFAGAPDPGQFNFGALFMALVGAAGCVIGGNMVHRRFGI